MNNSKEFRLQHQRKLPQNEKAIKAWYNYVFSKTSDNNQYFMRLIHPELDQVTELTEYFSNNFDSKHGIQTKWYDNGDTLSSGHFHFNRKEGPWRYFGHRDQKNPWLKRGNYHRGKKVGKWTTYYGNNIKSVYHYKDGDLHGDFIIYKNNGDILNQGSYEKGKIVSEINPLKSLTYNCIEGLSTDDENFAKNLLKEFLSTYKLSYPEDSRKKSIEGKARMLLLMDTNGKILEYHIINGVCEDISKECVKMVQSIKPCSDDVISKDDIFYVTVPFNFKLL